MSYLIVGLFPALIWGIMSITFHYVRGSAFEKIITKTIPLEEVVLSGIDLLISDKKQAKILVKIPQD
ncbi:protein of unknown function [Oenococcus oeni]|uniref:Uncharacterized protein n=1 Tax=Oenococcus oeni TaxID=1247 RepID=A0AAQ2UX41_OENOE|nr:hypothetical protein [Oenococcus oeni]SYW03791.1 hypothetical protein OENI_10001 [Oenococcus oeni]VDB98813.1 protein of unknown function [Oenococcus oeni]